jgi:hypothetical protein
LSFIESSGEYQQMNGGTKWPPQPHSRQPAHTHAPGVLQPKVSAPAQLKKGAVAPPVYRPQPVPKVLQRKATVQTQRPAPTNPANRPPAAPAVYRPQPTPKVLQRKAALQTPPGDATKRVPAAAPPVYRPVPKIVQPQTVANLKTPKVTPGAHVRPHAQAPARGAASVQRVICKGKTSGSKPIGTLKLSGWYKDLASDDHRAFALELHNKPEHYGKPEAEKIIEKSIKNGLPVPTFDINPKDVRRKRVTEYVNTTALNITDDSFEKGKHLAEAGERAYKRHFKKYKRNKTFDKSVEKIEEVKPGLFNDQVPILKGLKEWEQMVALTHSKPKSYNLDIDGNKITLDSIDLKSNEERSKKRKRESVNLNQLFIEQPKGKDSYWNISDSTDNTIGNTSPHKRLRHLEVERDNKSAFTTYLKDELNKSGKMTNKEAFGDEVPYAFQEFKGALNPSKNMLKFQLTSGYEVLQVGLKNPKTPLGKQVGKRPLTTPKKLNNALDSFMEKKEESRYKRLVKEAFRLFRTQTQIDIESDTESDSDSYSD